MKAIDYGPYYQTKDYQCFLKCWNGFFTCRDSCPETGGVYDGERLDKACLNSCKAEENACYEKCPDRQETTNEAPKEQETTNVGQNNAQSDPFSPKITPLWGGLARPFDELLLKARNIPPKPAKDLQGNDIAPSELEKNWKEPGSAVKIEVPLENLEKDRPVKTELPDGLPLRKAIFATYEPIKYAKTEITVFDGATTPKLLREEEKGGPIEYDEQEVPEEPDQKKYDMDFYFRIGIAVEGEEKHPFKEAMFELFPQLPYPDAYKYVRVLRWENDQQKWNEIPFQSDNCGQSGKTCRVIAKSPGTSYFAVVIEKEISSPFKLFFGVVFWLGILAIIILLFVRKRFKKRTLIILIATALLVSIATFIAHAQVAFPKTKHAVTLKTTLGDIKFETYDNEAPKTVENFISLARTSFYDKVIFHRVVKGFMIQSGDPTGTGSGGPGYAFEDELNPDTVSYKEGYKRGVVAMANSGPNTNGSQFFIMLADNDSLPRSYTIFGKVIKGQEVVDAIGNLQTDKSERPLNPPQIQSIVIERLR